MNKLFVSVLCFMVLSSCQTAFAENSIAVKGGYVSFANSKDSEYEGNTIMDNTMSGGYYVRHTNESMIYRLDIDTFETGNTFSHPIYPPYEKVDFKSRPVMLSIGRYQVDDKGLYGLIGVGILLNSMTVEMYAPSPFDYEIKNSPAIALTLGYDLVLDKHLYLFLEGRYLYSKADVYIQGSKNHSEDLSNIGIFGGLGWKF